MLGPFNKDLMTDFIISRNRQHLQFINKQPGILPDNIFNISSRNVILDEIIQSLATLLANFVKNKTILQNIIVFFDDFIHDEVTEIFLGLLAAVFVELDKPIR